MTDLRKAAEMALEALEMFCEHGAILRPLETKEALRQALAQPEQEQKTPLKVLNLTVFTENRLRNGRVYDVETLQAMTNRDILAIPDMGKKALKEVLEALDVHAVNMNQEYVDETAKGEHVIDCTDEQLIEEVRRRGFVIRDAQVGKKWVGLTVEEARKFYEKYTDREELIYAIDEFLEEKNDG